MCDHHIQPRDIKKNIKFFSWRNTQKKSPLKKVSVSRKYLSEFNGEWWMCLGSERQRKYCTHWWRWKMWMKWSNPMNIIENRLWKLCQITWLTCWNSNTVPKFPSIVQLKPFFFFFSFVCLWFSFCLLCFLSKDKVCRCPIQMHELSSEHARIRARVCVTWQFFIRFWIHSFILLLNLKDMEYNVASFVCYVHSQVTSLRSAAVFLCILSYCCFFLLLSRFLLLKRYIE